MRYTYVRQHDSTDCAAASLAMVCLHYKKEITITRLRDMMGTDMKGTNLVGLQKAANELGFSTAAVRVDRENFLSDFTLPAIAQVITDQGMTHFVVIFKKTTIKEDDARRKHVVQEEERKADASKKYKCKDYVVIGDPANELKKISLDEFYKNFTGVLLLLNPTAEFKGGTGKHKVEGKEEAKAARNNMLKRYMDLLLPQKKLFAYAILSSVILTLIGIVSTVFNKAIMDRARQHAQRDKQQFFRFHISKKPFRFLLIICGRADIYAFVLKNRSRSLCRARPRPFRKAWLWGNRSCRQRSFCCPRPQTGRFLKNTMRR